MSEWSARKSLTTSSESTLSKCALAKDTMPSLPPTTRSLFAGFVLGDDRGQPPEVVDDFRGAGLTHLLVVSGELGLKKFSRHWWSLVGLFFLVTVSHGILDAMTDGGLGVAFFSPFDTTRYFFLWRPIRVSPIGVGRIFSAQGAAIMASEMEYVWLPLATLWAGVVILRRNFARKSRTENDSPSSHPGQPKQ